MALLGVKIKFRQIFLGCTKPTLWEEALQSSKKSQDDLPTFKEYVRACAHRVHKTNLPVMISSQAIRKMFMYFLGSTYMQHVTLYILGLEQMQGWKSYWTGASYNQLQNSWGTFPNSVHHQGRTLASARDFLPSSFRSCPCKFWIHVFHGIVTTFNNDNRGGGRNHVKSVLTTFFGLNSYSVSRFLPVVVT